MATSQNGWPAFSSGTHPDLVAIPHVAGRVRRGDVATIFIYLNDRFDREVEDLDEAAGQPQDDWGWASRPIIGNPTDLSNHASGTAEDLNATRHPLGKVGTFTRPQVVALRAILDALGGVVRWGGDYPGRKDEMHFEINASPARVAQVAAAIRAGQLVSNPSGGTPTITIPTVPGAPAPITPRLEDDMSVLARTAADATVWLGDGITRRKITSLVELERLQFLAGRGLLSIADGGRVQTVPDVALLGVDVESVAGRVWAHPLTHTLSGRATPAADFLRYEPAEHKATRTVLATAVAEAVARIPGVDPNVVRDLVAEGITNGLEAIETTTTVTVKKG
ncbi:M15 family metallopeptidase [Cellulosimicrobium sp. CpK407]|uniref:M15 family metallopeptidase n=1 Tax=Cellulosimicrobium sp. CpK407 TaxID=3229847 RepID=UPI003F3E54E9